MLGSKSLGEIFHRGDHKEILRRTVDAPAYRLRDSDLPYVIGAMTFLGRLEDARNLFAQRSYQLVDSKLASCRFFIGIGECRHSHYDSARKYFIANLRDFARSQNLTSAFFAHQGVGFYRFIHSQYRLAFQSASRAREAALGAKFLYGKYLASDLMGHSLVQIGQIALGMKHLHEAVGFTDELGDRRVSHSSMVSLHVYGVQFSQKPKQDITRLKRLHLRLPNENTYSQAAVLLELGRQYTLRGQLRLSQDVLNEACRHIHASRLRRHGAILNLRYAYNFYLSGENYQALNLVRNAYSDIDPRMDLGIKIHALGLEARVRRGMGILDGIEQIEKETEHLTQRTGLGLARRIHARSAGQPGVFTPGEDPVGDLLDASRRKESDVIEKILRGGYLGMLTELLNLPIGKPALFLDLLPGSLLVADRGNLFFVREGLTTLLRSLLGELAQGQTEKERLIEKVWGHHYHPLRHDSLVYPAISKLRQLLGPAAHWLEARDAGYRLSPEITVLSHKNPPARLPALSPPPLDSDLNFRQLTILRKMHAGEFIDVQAYRKRYQISQVTAFRDLSDLVARKLLQRSGRARATRYSI